ncbi:MAG: hypothetical protein BWK78_00600 [Thiotrichaceae bacterium IS1]|nr:MAG: hypothetical protein BWK78_00600 [Thiotrichaceae bacterium IS1]
MPFDAKKALVVLLGAEEWPGCPALVDNSYPQNNNPFRNSVEEIEKYFRGTLGIEETHLKSWFNSTGKANTILEEIEDFITNKTSQNEMTDIFFYYVGHGTHLEKGDHYHLLVHSTKITKPSSAIQIGRLFEIMKVEANNLRCYLILDACFSETAYDFLPDTHQKGVGLFYSSGKTEQSLVVEGERNFTLFTQSLLESLNKGDKTLPQWLSFNDLTGLIKEFVVKNHGSQEIPAPRCGFHHRSDEIEKIAIFPNPSYSLSKTEEVPLIEGATQDLNKPKPSAEVTKNPGVVVNQVVNNKGPIGKQVYMGNVNGTVNI